MAETSSEIVSNCSMLMLLRSEPETEDQDGDE